ncbi:hypothetical protein H4582DRAFT_2082994 [Lactarius indigo]|nr:hypothetical protein H4582DRAFT_2082994 [Lactarius indigo]
MTYRDPAIPDAPKRAATSIEATLPFSTLVESPLVASPFSALLEPEKVHGDRSVQMVIPRWSIPNIFSDTAHKFDPATQSCRFRSNARLWAIGFFVGWVLGTLPPFVLSSTSFAMRIHIKAFRWHPYEREQDAWAHARGRLIKASAVNEAALKHIESAMIAVPGSVMVVTDDTTSVLIHDVIVSDYERSAFPGELACMDDTPALRLNEFILTWLPHGTSSLTPSHEIVFTANNDAVLADMKEAERNFSKFVGSHDLQVLHYDTYSENLVKQFKAFSRCMGIACEAAGILGTAGRHSKAWIDPMVDLNATDAQRAALFRRAVARHAQYSVWVVNGVDRHLFGLKKVFSAS